MNWEIPGLLIKEFRGGGGVGKGSQNKTGKNPYPHPGYHRER